MSRFNNNAQVSTKIRVNSESVPHVKSSIEDGAERETKSLIDGSDKVLSFSEDGNDAITCIKMTLVSNIANIRIIQEWRARDNNNVIEYTDSKTGDSIILSEAVLTNKITAENTKDGTMDVEFKGISESAA